MMKYKHLTSEQRHTIFCLYRQGVSLRKIATTISVATSTVSREFKRNRNECGKYFHKQAPPPECANPTRSVVVMSGTKIMDNNDTTKRTLPRLSTLEHLIDLGANEEQAAISLDVWDLILPNPVIDGLLLYLE